jgi:hypothetical protein
MLMSVTGSASDKSICVGEWNATEREAFKRFFLIYGYGRWQLMREAAKNAGYNIEEKPDEEMTIYANALIMTLID